MYVGKETSKTYSACVRYPTERTDNSSRLQQAMNRGNTQHGQWGCKRTGTGSGTGGAIRGIPGHREPLLATGTFPYRVHLYSMI